MICKLLSFIHPNHYMRIQVVRVVFSVQHLVTLFVRSLRILAMASVSTSQKTLPSGKDGRYRGLPSWTYTSCGRSCSGCTITKMFIGHTVFSDIAPAKRGKKPRTPHEGLAFPVTPWKPETSEWINHYQFLWTPYLEKGVSSPSRSSF